jgi:hypothetical protein
VGNVSLAVFMPFKIHTVAWSGEHRAFAVEFVQNGGSPIMTQHAIHIHFALGRRDPVPDKRTARSWVSNLRQTGSALKRKSTGRPCIGNCGHCESFN